MAFHEIHPQKVHSCCYIEKGVYAGCYVHQVIFNGITMNSVDPFEEDTSVQGTIGHEYDRLDTLFHELLPYFDDEKEAVRDWMKWNLDTICDLS